MASEHGKGPSDRDTEEEKVVNAAFALGFTGETCFQESQAPEMSGKVRTKEGFALGWYQVRQHLNQLDVVQWTSS